jgi:hypothetical protein
MFQESFHNDDVSLVYVFCPGQVAKFTSTASTVNRISENHLALPMPAAFFSEIPAKPKNVSWGGPEAREIFTLRA